MLNLPSYIRRWFCLPSATGLFCFALFAASLAAREPVISEVSLDSQVLHETRDLQIILPDGYDPDGNVRYEVLYVLDGEYNTEMVDEIQRWVQHWEFMPPVIIVGIDNHYVNGVNLRSRDFIPMEIPEVPHTGGADPFLAFLRDELLPYVNDHYRTNGRNILWGQSYGGTFAIYALLREPGLFAASVAADPNCVVGDRFLATLARQVLPTFSAGSPRQLHILGRAGPAYEAMGIASLAATLTEVAPPQLRWHAEALPDESHNSVKFKSLYDGLKFVHRGFNPGSIEFHPMGGILLPGEPIRVAVISSPVSLRFTVDGTTPDMGSSPVAGPIRVEGTTELRVKLVNANDQTGGEARGRFVSGAALPARSNTPVTMPGGVRYACYEGEWDAWPDWSALAPFRTGITSEGFDFSHPTGSSVSHGCVLDGYFDAPTAGHYYLIVSGASEGVRLEVDGQRLIDFTAPTNHNRYQSAVVPLAAGLHTLHVEHWRRDDGPPLNLLYIPPGVNEPSPVPSALLSHVPATAQ